MKATVISENKKRMTAMIVIHYDENGRKRSETRHCKGMVGRVLDVHSDLLSIAQARSEHLARKVDALNLELDNKAKRALSYTAQLFFAWVEGDNEGQYKPFIAREYSRAQRILEQLISEIERLEPLAEVRRVERLKKQKEAA